MSQHTRRQFFEDTLIAAAAAATAGTATKPVLAQETSKSAGEKLTVAIIGCGIRGKQHARELARYDDCEIAYVCDPDSSRTAEVSTQLKEAGRRAPETRRPVRAPPPPRAAGAGARHIARRSRR